MAETHEEVVKVWIAPGCIVCDACETDCPDVFEVQEETCIIRPDAHSEDFTKPLTPSIKVAAEGCPVDVIKFETVQVDGPEPWAGQEEEAAATAGAAGAGLAAGPAVTIPQGPPDPKWASLLTAAQISHRGRSDLPDERTATVPVEAVAEALPLNAPPDASAAAMVGSGYVRPGTSVAERIRVQGEGVTRREVSVLGGVSVVVLAAWGALGGVFATCLGALQSFMVPKVTKEPPSIFRAGRVTDYPEVGVYMQYKGSQGVWLARLAEGKLVAISTTCTHLGCIPNWLPGDQKFKCPCHGSGFDAKGMNFEGPAPRPLERHKIYFNGEFVVVDKSKKYRQELGQWSSPESFIEV